MFLLHLGFGFFFFLFVLLQGENRIRLGRYPLRPAQNLTRFRHIV